MAEKNSSSVHDGHRDRVRDKFRKSGFDSMNPHEILEMLLFYSVPRKDTNEIAHELIKHFGSLTGVLEASEEELVRVKGITRNSAILIRMILPLYREYTKDASKAAKLKSPDECGLFFLTRYKAVRNETVMLACFDSGNRVVCVEEICEGDASAVSVNVRKIIELVMKYPKITAAVIAHNHPNGISLPSREDVNATEELKKTLGAMGVSLIDHIIVADDDYVSMAASSGFGCLFR